MHTPLFERQNGSMIDLSSLNRPSRTEQAAGSAIEGVPMRKLIGRVDAGVAYFGRHHVQQSRRHEHPFIFLTVTTYPNVALFSLPALAIFGVFRQRLPDVSSFLILS